MILLFLTNMVTAETTMSIRRPILYFILFVWNITEIVFLQIMLISAFKQVFRLSIACVYVFIYICQYHNSNKMVNKRQSLEFQEKSNII
jgi:hypothetical protein